jgi:hypothetical protein
MLSSSPSRATEVSTATRTGSPARRRRRGRGGRGSTRRWIAPALRSSSPSSEAAFRGLSSVSVIATSPGPEARIFRALSISSSFTPVLREGCSERGASVKSTTSTSMWMGVAIRPRSEGTRAPGAPMPRAFSVAATNVGSAPSSPSMCPSAIQSSAPSLALAGVFRSERRSK